MQRHSSHPPRGASGDLLEEAALGVEELSRACAAEPQWVLERVGAGLLACVGGTAFGERRFASVELVRARRLRSIERDFDANPELAALAVDLIEEVERLRRLLAASDTSRADRG
jgi:chaperone modulatory protein CbpM